MATTISPIHAWEPDSAEPVAGLSSSKRPPDYAVAQCLRTTARIVSLSLSATGLSQRAAATQASVSRTLVESWCDEDGLRSIPLSRVLTLATGSRRGREAALAILTAALSHVERDSEPVEHDLRDDVVQLAVETGEVATAVREALADGHVTDAERRRIASEIQGVERLCASMLQALAVSGG